MDNAEKFCDGRDMIINAFQDKIFKFYHEENMFEVEVILRMKIDYKKFDLTRIISLKGRYK